MTEVSQFTRIMAIDYGTKRIGLALTDPLITFAYPYKTILNDSNLWYELEKIVRDQNVSKIVLGYPLKENGEPSSITNNVLKFKKQLEEKLGLEVLLRDERYSSSIAKEIINKSITKKSKRRDKSLLDKGSAAIILQDYLNELGKLS